MIKCSRKTVSPPSKWTALRSFKWSFWDHKHGLPNSVNGKWFLVTLSPLLFLISSHVSVLGRFSSRFRVRQVFFKLFLRRKENKRPRERLECSKIRECGQICHETWRGWRNWGKRNRGSGILNSSSSRLKCVKVQVFEKNSLELRQELTTFDEFCRCLWNAGQIVMGTIRGELRSSYSASSYAYNPPLNCSMLALWVFRTETFILFPLARWVKNATTWRFEK